MSLVNDMLRDLDQRRKGSDNNGATNNLTPAPDTPKAESRFPAPILFGGLAVIALGLGFFWWQLSSSDSTQQLNIRPQVSTTPDQPVETVELAESTMQEESLEEQVPESLAEPESVTETTALPRQEPPIAQTPAPVVNEEARIDTPVQPADTTVAVTDAASNEGTLPDPGAQQPAGELDAPDAVPAPAIAGNDEGNVDIINQQPEDSVKDVAELTPEGADLAAVQEALRLLANNQTMQAYARLEQHILDNRYAHQSRETYAKLLMSQGNLFGAAQVVDGGLQLAPNHAGFKKIRARLMIAEGQIDEAVSLLLSRAPEVAEDLEYHDILASAQLASRDYEGAVLSYRGLVQQDQSQGKWWYGFAASQDSLGNAPAARQGYTQAMQLSNLSASLRRRSQERLTALRQ